MQTEWNPSVGDKVSIEAMSESEYGSWAVSAPTIFTPDAVIFGLQLTAPMPLSAIQDLFRMLAVGDQSNPFYPGSARPAFVVEKDDLAKLDVMDEDDIDDNVLGFFSLILSYAKAAFSKGAGMKDNGPKQLINFMPRTDFGTMFNLYIKGKLDSGRECRQKKKEEVNLFTVVKDLGAKEGLDVEPLEFMWNPPRCTPNAPPDLGTTCAPPPPPPVCFPSVLSSMMRADSLPAATSTTST